MKSLVSENKQEYKSRHPYANTDLFVSLSHQEHKKVLELSEEKVQLANQAYDVVRAGISSSHTRFVFSRGRSKLFLSMKIHCVII